MDQDIIDVARTIRFYLPELVSDKADAYDNEIKDLLARAHEGVDVGDEIMAVLTRSGVKEWVIRVFEDEYHRPPVLLPRDRGAGYQPPPGAGGYQSPPGKPTPVLSDKYECPVDRNYVWYRPSVGFPVPDCKDHPGVRLVPAASDAQ
ncbi:hypothetical protein ACF1BE_32190 [Streptomyces sp. NPDC014991]|uniref:hypothetical protein n=1 Tax=Streptomyces sp. NPDC014991 TaxID=3364935 RepID=UPI0036FA07F4